MPVSPISKVPEKEQRELLNDLNYINTAEIKSFCKRQSIPHAMAMETNIGCRRKTNEDDRKGVILDRIRHFLKSGVVLGETCFRATVVCFEAPPGQLGPND